jgi:CRP/FNR family transcriptional regulator
MFQNDLIGLAEHGRYVNSAKSVTATILFKIPTQTLEARLRQSPGLEFHIIMKLCHELRRTQDRALLLSKHHTSAKIGLFVQMLEAEQQARGENTTELYLPMTRTDIGAYVGISPEAVSRGFAELAGCGVIAFKDRRHLIVVDRAKLTAAIAETSRPGSVAGARRRRTREPA